MSLSLITAPTSAVSLVSLEMAKLQTRVTHTSEDDLFVQLIEAARDRAENETLRALGTQTWEETFDGFPGCGYITIQKPPLQSVTLVKYRDTTGTLQTWASSNYVVEAPAGPKAARGRLSLASGVNWPTTYGQAGDVVIRFVCGYTPSTLPALLRQAMLLDLSALYRNRDAVVEKSLVEMPTGARDIYRRYVSHPTQRRAA